MMRGGLTVVAVVGLVMSGCSSGGPLSGPTAQPSDQGSDLAAPPDPGQPHSGALRLDVPPEPIEEAPSGPPAKRDWAKVGVTSDRRQADSEACYRFALAQVSNDIRIDDDISSARNEAFSQNSRLTVHTQRIDSYYYENERNARFEDCMRSKGYDLE